MSGVDIAIGRWRFYARPHWRLRLWQHRFFWISAKLYQAGVVLYLIGVQVALHKVRSE